jgi:hypothetical protein
LGGAQLSYVSLQGVVSLRKKYNTLQTNLGTAMRAKGCNLLQKSPQIAQDTDRKLVVRAIRKRLVSLFLISSRSSVSACDMNAISLLQGTVSNPDSVTARLVFFDKS